MNDKLHPTQVPSLARLSSHGSSSLSGHRCVLLPKPEGSWAPGPLAAPQRWFYWPVPVPTTQLLSGAPCCAPVALAARTPVSPGRLLPVALSAALLFQAGSPRTGCTPPFLSTPHCSSASLHLSFSAKELPLEASLLAHQQPGCHRG